MCVSVRVHVPVVRVCVHVCVCTCVCQCVRVHVCHSLSDAHLGAALWHLARVFHRLRSAPRASDTRTHAHRPHTRKHAHKKGNSGNSGRSGMIHAHARTHARTHTHTPPAAVEFFGVETRGCVRAVCAACLAGKQSASADT
eukprot:1498425-Rhodomonas_salina.2